MRQSPAIEYLRARGVSESQVRDYEIGYFPEDTWPPFIKGDTDDITQYLRWSSKGYRLRGKLVFPIRNAIGSLRGIQVRSPDPDVKDYSKFYLNRSQVDGVFFGIKQALPHIWETQEVYLCEGLFDLFPLQRIFPNTLCTGTANVSRDQLVFLERFVDHVNIVFDMDWGGDQFYEKFNKEQAHRFKSVRRLKFMGKDVSEAWQRLGEEGLQKRLTATRL